MATKWYDHNCWEQIRTCLTKDPILAIPDLTPDANPFVLLTDACKTGIAGILMQKGADGHLHPISYASRITDTKERERYHQYQLETAAIVWSMNVFKPYLRHKAVPFILAPNRLPMSIMATYNRPRSCDQKVALPAHRI